MPVRFLRPGLHPFNFKYVWNVLIMHSSGGQKWKWGNLNVNVKIKFSILSSFAAFFVGLSFSPIQVAVHSYKQGSLITFSQEHEVWNSFQNGILTVPDGFIYRWHPSALRDNEECTSRVEVTTAGGSLLPFRFPCFGKGFLNSVLSCIPVNAKTS